MGWKSRINCWKVLTSCSGKDSIHGRRVKEHGRSAIGEHGGKAKINIKWRKKTWDACCEMGEHESGVKIQYTVVVSRNMGKLGRSAMRELGKSDMGENGSRTKFCRLKQRWEGAKSSFSWFRQRFNKMWQFERTWEKRFNTQYSRVKKEGKEEISRYSFHGNAREVQIHASASSLMHSRISNNSNWVDSLHFFKKLLPASVISSKFFIVLTHCEAKRLLTITFQYTVPSF